MFCDFLNCYFVSYFGVIASVNGVWRLHLYFHISLNVSVGRAKMKNDRRMKNRKIFKTTQKSFVCEFLCFLHIRSMGLRKCFSPLLTLDGPLCVILLCTNKLLVIGVTTPSVTHSIQKQQRWKQHEKTTCWINALTLFERYTFRVQNDCTQKSINISSIIYQIFIIDHATHIPNTNKIPKMIRTIKTKSSFDFDFKVDLFQMCARLATAIHRHRLFIWSTEKKRYCSFFYVVIVLNAHTLTHSNKYNSIKILCMCRWVIFSRSWIMSDQKKWK